MKKIKLEIDWKDVRSLAHTIHPPQLKNEYLSLWFDVNDSCSMMIADKYLEANKIKHEIDEIEDGSGFSIGYIIYDETLNELEYIS